MKPALALGAAALLLVGCKDRVADAKAQLAIVERGGDRDATCATARKLADAYLQRQDEGGYHEATVAANIECQAADLARNAD